MRHGIRNIVLGCILLSMATAALAGESAEIRLKDGSRWKGELSDAVQLTYLRHGAQVELKGHLVTAAEWYVTIATDVAGEIRNQTIFKNDILVRRSRRGRGAEWLRDDGGTDRLDPSRRDGTWRIDLHLCDGGRGFRACNRSR